MITVSICQNKNLPVIRVYFLLYIRGYICFKPANNQKVSGNGYPKPLK